MSRGGFREGSGRKKGIDTVAVRVPSDISHFVRMLSASYRDDPDSFLHLVDGNRAQYILGVLSSGSVNQLSLSSSRLKRQKRG